MQYDERAKTPKHAQALLDAWAEGVIQANMATLARDKDDYPCCCGCGGYVLVPLRILLPQMMTKVSAKGPQGLLKAKRGNAFELACYQCANRRLEGDAEAFVSTGVDECGNLECWVIRTLGDDENMTKYLPEECEGGACDCVGVGV